MNPDIASRVRAARGAANLNLDDFAAAIGVGRSTQIRTENGTRTPKGHELKRIAEVSGLPLGFFTVEDLDAALDGPSRPKLEKRVSDLENELRNAIGFLTAADVALRTELEALAATDQTQGQREGHGRG